MTFSALENPQINENLERLVSLHTRQDALELLAKAE